MPANLNIVVLKPADADDNDTTDRNVRQLQFTKEFTIRKDVVLAQLRFLKANYSRYRDISINNQVDLLYNANIIDQVANSQYKGSTSKDAASNQRLRIQPEANPTNSAEEESTIKDDRFDSGTILAINTDRNIDNNLDNLRRQVGARAPLGS